MPRRRHVSTMIGNVMSIVIRDARITFSYRTAFVLDLLYGLINLFLFYFISQALPDAGTGSLGDAPDYFSFVAVGVTITMVVQAASSGLARRIREEQLTGTLEALFLQPVTSTQVALGLAGFPFLFAAVRLIVYLSAAVLLLGLDVSEANPLGVIVIVAASGGALVWVGIAIAALVILIRRAEALAPFITLGMGFAGGAFFPPEVLPQWLHPLTVLVPTRYAYDGAREALYAGTGWGGEALVLVGATVVGVPAALALFRWSLDRARRTGSLGGY